MRVSPTCHQALLPLGKKNGDCSTIQGMGLINTKSMADKAACHSAFPHKAPVHCIMMYPGKALHRQRGKGKHFPKKPRAPRMVRDHKQSAGPHYPAHLPKNARNNAGLVFVQRKTYGGYIKGGLFEPCLGSVSPNIYHASPRFGRSPAQHGSGAVQTGYAQLPFPISYSRQRGAQRPRSAADIQHSPRSVPKLGVHNRTDRPVHGAQQWSHTCVVHGSYARVRIGCRHILLRESSLHPPSTANVG